MATTFNVVVNLAKSTLASGIDDDDLALDVAAGEGAKFPSTYPFNLSLDTEALREIVKVTNRSTDTCTIVRAQEGTAAIAHSAGVRVALDVTAKQVTDLNSAVNTLEGKMPDTTHPVTQAFSDAADEGVASTLARIDHRHGMPAGGGATIVLKTADETVNNSSVLQNDDHLLLAMAANEAWVIDIILYYLSVSATPDIKCDAAIPNGASGAYVAWGLDYANAVYTAATAIGTTCAFGATAGVLRVARITYVVVNGATAGNFQFQWAQRTATAEDTTMKTNSCLIAHQVA